MIGEEATREVETLTTKFAVLCILHGDPVLPAWLSDPALDGILHLVVNDPAPDTYSSLPPGAAVHVNTDVLGFAANVNAHLDQLFVGSDVVLCANFDLELDPKVLAALAARAREGRYAAVAPVLCDAEGRSIFSAGSLPTSLKEFTRATGLRTGRVQDALRGLLRRQRGWVERNLPGTLDENSYLPWTLIAICREAWRDVGPLDERFPMYAEDIDWGMRAHQRGWACALVDVGHVQHVERATASALTNAMYEVSHQRLHMKHGWFDNARWQARGLTLRRHLLRRLTPPLDWDYLDRKAALGPAPDDRAE